MPVTPVRIQRFPAVDEAGKTRLLMAGMIRDWLSSWRTTGLYEMLMHIGINQQYWKGNNHRNGYLDRLWRNVQRSSCHRTHLLGAYCHLPCPVQIVDGILTLHVLSRAHLATPYEKEAEYH